MLPQNTYTQQLLETGFSLLGEILVKNIRNMNVFDFFLCDRQNYQRVIPPNIFANHGKAAKKLAYVTSQIFRATDTIKSLTLIPGER